MDVQDTKEREGDLSVDETKVSKVARDEFQQWALLAEAS